MDATLNAIYVIKRELKALNPKLHHLPPNFAPLLIFHPIILLELILTFTYIKHFVYII